MRPPSLSYETPAAASQTRGARAPVAHVARTAAPGFAASSVAAPHGRSTAQRRQRRVAITALAVLHALAILALLNASRLRDPAAEARPVFLAVLDAPAAVAPPRPLPPPPAARMPAPPPLPLPPIVPEPSPSPSPVLAPAAAPTPPVAALTAPAAPAPVPAPSLPRTIPPSAVQYLVPPAPVYSRISAKMHESGKVLVRVWIDEAGVPRDVQLAASTGFARLDDAALTAVRNCRFRPYLENGVAVAGWAVIPIEFELPA
jgi:protein TonB